MAADDEGRSETSPRMSGIDITPPVWRIASIVDEEGSTNAAGTSQGSQIAKGRGRLPAYRRSHDASRSLILLLLFTVLFESVVVGCFLRTSATFDEHQHLTAGYVALSRGDYRFSWGHLPFLRLWAALPLAGRSGVAMETAGMAWTSWDEWVYAWQFTSVLNDEARLLLPARFMISLLGTLLGVLLFAWARELFGFAAAAVVLVLYLLEPNLIAHAGLVTTDLGVTCFIFGAVYFLWRTVRTASPGNIAGLCVFFALSIISKFSALALVPTTLLLLLPAALGRNPWPLHARGSVRLPGRWGRLGLAAALLLLLTVVTWGALWASYGFRYLPTPDGGTRVQDTLPHPEVATAGVSPLHIVADWIDSRHLVPNAAAQGFARTVTGIDQRPSYLFGRFSDKGWWFYFPVAFLIKTPVGHLLLFVAGVGLLIRDRRSVPGTRTFLLLPPALFLAAAMMTHINIGLRHILPVYPFVLLVAGRAVVAATRRSHRLLLAVPLLLSCLEFAMVSPHYLAFFNVAVGGAARGHRYLLDSNLDWGQDLKELKRWMDREGIPTVNLAYFGTADPSSYGIACTHLPGAPFFAEARAELPRLPGYVAVSANFLYGLGFQTRKWIGWEGFYRPLLLQRPEARIGYSIFVYRVERPWW